MKQEILEHLEGASYVLEEIRHQLEECRFLLIGHPTSELYLRIQQAEKLATSEAKSSYELYRKVRTGGAA